MRRSRLWAALAAVAAALASTAAWDRAGAVASAATGPFVPGSGTATARVAGLALRSSGPAIAVRFGMARAQYQGAQGNARAAAADLGLLALAMDTPFVCNVAPGQYFPDGVLPRPIAVSSGDGPVHERSDSFGAGTTAALGHQEASAAPQSQAAAKVAGVSLTLPGLVELDGGLSTSGARLTPGSQRDAEARADIGSLVLAGGLVRLDGLTWTAGHHSGASTDQVGSFGVAKVSVAGVDLPTGDAAALSAALDTANETLRPLGLALHPPGVVAGAGGVEVTPLRLSIDPNPAARAAAGPVLAGAQPARNALLEAVAPIETGDNCKLRTGLGFGFLLADLATVVLGDGGGIDLDFGGARAGTAGPVYANPFDSGFGAITLPSPSRRPTPPSRAATGIPDSDPPARSPRAVMSARPAPQAPVAPVALPVEESAAVAPPAQVYLPASDLGSAVCASSHPRGGPACARGDRAGVVAAWLALLIAAILAVADKVRSRRPPSFGAASGSPAASSAAPR